MKGRRITIFGMGILIAVTSFSSSLLADTQTGIASVYSGEQTANGEYAHASALTAAHRTLPFGTMVEVTNTQTGAPSSFVSTIAVPSSGVGHRPDASWRSGN